MGDLIGDLWLLRGIQAPGARALLPPEAVVLRSLKLLSGRQPDAEIVPWLMEQEAAFALPFPLQEAAMSHSSEAITGCWPACSMISSIADRHVCDCWP